MKKIIILLITFLSLIPLKYNKIKGNIITINKNTFMILTENNTIYEINKPNNFNYNINDNIEIIYSNDLNNFVNIQNIKINKINLINTITFKNNSLFKKYEEKAIKKLNNMTIEEKIGQLLLVRIPEKNKLKPILSYNIGGYILFKGDIDNKTKEELINEIKNYQKNSKIPLLIAIDEEGGKISRLSSNKKILQTPFLSPQELYKQNKYKAIKNDTINKNKILFELGINLNLAPVADVSENKNDYIYDRTFGKNGKETAKYIETVLQNTSKEVSYTLKHFPGYGNNKDTHKGYSIDERPYETFENNDFLPFISGIKNKAEAILFSHNYMNCVDKLNPSTLSPNVHNILKNQLNYNNIIITDDISMKGLDDIENKYKKALLAGNNILIVTDYQKAYSEILTSYKNKEISETLINYLVKQNISWKYYKNLMEDL